jgi:hypothetical protein
VIDWRERERGIAMPHVAILVVLALTLLGCGGSDSDSDTGTPTTVTATTTAPTASADTTTTSQRPATTSGSNGDASFANCPELLTWTNDFVAANQAAFAGGTDPTGFEYTAEYFQEFASRAPDEIRDDMQVITDAFSGFFDALAELDVDFTDPSSMASLTPAQIQQLEDAAEMMGTDAVDEAGDNINAFFERECS